MLVDETLRGGYIVVEMTLTTAMERMVESQTAGL